MLAQRLNWDDLRFVLAIGRERSLSGAARRLGVNHATVFRRLRAIEAEVGVRLFERLPEGYCPTAAGEEAIAVGAALDEQVAALELRIAGRDLRPSGLVRLTSVEALMYDLLPPIIERFRQAHPDITLELVTTPVTLNLSRRDADVALRATNAPDATLVGRRLGRLASAIYASERYLADAPPLEDLAAQDWVGYEDGLRHLQAAAWLARLLGERPARLKVNTVLAVRQLVAAGVGLGILPCMLGDALPGLRRVTPPDPAWDSQVWILTHPDVRAVARIRAVMGFFGDEVARLAPRLAGERPTPAPRAIA